MALRLSHAHVALISWLLECGRLQDLCLKGMHSDDITGRTCCKLTRFMHRAAALLLSRWHGKLRCLKQPQQVSPDVCRTLQHKLHVPSSLSREP